jgi:hypothetical protein
MADSGGLLTMFFGKNRTCRIGAFALSVLFAFPLFSWAASSDDANPLLVQIDAPEADVIKAVQEVVSDQIVHGTYSYEKEKILYGAHPSDSSRAFGTWQDPGKLFYKVADRVLAPRFFKNSGDIGTVTVRYIVQGTNANSTSLRIDAIFIDARNEKHVSTGNVESQEYAAIQEHLRDLQSQRTAEQNAEQEIARRREEAEKSKKIAAIEESAASSSSSEAESLERKIHQLRHQVEMRVTGTEAALKSAPFHGASTITTLPSETAVVVMVVTPYWYGVQTEDGHRGWLHHSQLESLPQ